MKRGKLVTIAIIVGVVLWLRGRKGAGTAAATGPGGGAAPAPVQGPATFDEAFVTAHAQALSKFPQLAPVVGAQIINRHPSGLPALDTVQYLDAGGQVVSEGPAPGFFKPPGF